MASFWEKIRKDFPNTRESVYLDHAAGGPIPLPVKKQIESYLQENAQEADFAWPKWMKRREAIREKVAAFINSEPEEIAFTHSTSHGMNCIAELLAGRGKVLTNTSEFPSSTLPWVWRDADIVFQEPEKSVISLEKLESLLSPSVRTVVTSYVQYGTGFRQDLTRLGKMKKDRWLVVNATQALGALPVDVKAWNADFMCSNSYKWLMAGYGGGILYMKKKWLKKFRPASIGWRSVRNADKMDNRKAKALPAAARYEPGCPSFGTVFAVGAAVDYLSGIGMERIAGRIGELIQYAADVLEKNGFGIVSSLEPAHRSGILVIGMKRAERIWRRLIGQKVFVSARGEGLRLGPHFYNSEEEIDCFVAKLKKACSAEKRVSVNK